MKTKQCESCGMPLERLTTSFFEDRYCVHCQDQRSGQLANREQVKEGSINAVVRLFGKTPAEAEKVVDNTMATLPRWQKLLIEGPRKN